MGDRVDKIGRAISAFVENPVTKLMQGLVLITIGVIDASRTFREDIANGHVRVGHGLIIIGFFSALEALPHVIEGLEASRKYWEAKANKIEGMHEAGDPPANERR